MLFKGELIYPIVLGHYTTFLLSVYPFRLFMGVNKHGVQQEKFYQLKLQAHDTPHLEYSIISPHLEKTRLSKLTLCISVVSNRP